MKELISIIIPVYNAEKMLRSCLKSVLNQTYTNLEIIIVNDGSTDNSLKICNILKAEDNRIKLINQKNSGVSTARNLGISHACGEYLVFIDSDDFLEVNMIEKLHSALTTENVDMAVCGYIVHDLALSSNMSENITLRIINDGQTVNVSNIAANFWGYFDKGIINPLWNKIYKTSIINENQLKFPTSIPMGEDGYFNVLYLMHSRKVKIMNEGLYHYIKHVTQSSNKVFYNYFDIMMENFNVIEKFINQYDGFLNTETLNRHLYEVFKVLKHSVLHMEKSKLFKSNEKKILVKEMLMTSRIEECLDNVQVKCFKDKIFYFLLKNKCKKDVLFYLRMMIIMKGLTLWKK